jgi:hypothetical protein
MNKRTFLTNPTAPAYHYRPASPSGVTKLKIESGYSSGPGREKSVRFN